jgi:hypothetical protein
MKSPLVRIVVLSAICAFVPLSEADAQRRCSKGIPCGNTCIAAGRTCRVGTPSANPQPPTQMPSTPSSPPPPGTLLPQAATPTVDSATAQQQGLAVPGVPGFFALDSIELLEVQAARMRALERQRAHGGMAGAPTLTTPAPPSSAPSATQGGPWTASRRGSVYYRTGCRSANELAAQNRIFFQSEEEAQEAGYRRSTAAGC